MLTSSQITSLETRLRNGSRVCLVDVVYKS